MYVVGFLHNYSRLVELGRLLQYLLLASSITGTSTSSNTKEPSSTCVRAQLLNRGAGLVQLIFLQLSPSVHLKSRKVNTTSAEEAAATAAGVVVVVVGGGGSRVDGNKKCKEGSISFPSLSLSSRDLLFGSR